jgi:hypothetical protein
MSTYRITLRVRPGPVPDAQRLRALLKHARRCLALDCTRVEEMPTIEPLGHPEAWNGWVQLQQGWVRVCCARSEAECGKLLAERTDLDTYHRKILPRGGTP